VLSVWGDNRRKPRGREGRVWPIEKRYRIEPRGAFSDLGRKERSGNVPAGISRPPAPSPPTPTAYTRGLAALNEGNFDAAIAEFTAAIADDPKDTFLYIRRGTAYEKKGDAAAAIGDYRKVLKLVDADTGAKYAAKIRKLEKTKK
jgi:tetratricopeptide (TPR) repeat protein